MTYKSVTTEVTFFQEKEGMFGDSTSIIRVEDEGGGAFIRISQPCLNKNNPNTIELNPKEIKPLMEFSLRLLEDYNKTINEEEEDF